HRLAMAPVFHVRERQQEGRIQMHAIKLTAAFSLGGGGRGPVWTSELVPKKARADMLHCTIASQISCCGAQLPWSGQDLLRIFNV
ncbi:MAG: hypothetical protein AAFQ22_16185, partial [Pseudomonadota bacterium]